MTGRRRGVPVVLLALDLLMIAVLLVAVALIASAVGRAVGRW